MISNTDLAVVLVLFKLDRVWVLHCLLSFNYLYNPTIGTVALTRSGILIAMGVVLFCWLQKKIAFRLTILAFGLVFVWFWHFLCIVLSTLLQITTAFARKLHLLLTSNNLGCFHSLISNYHCYGCCANFLNIKHINNLFIYFNSTVLSVFLAFLW